jgi:simple sugar transport system permease protein
LLDKRRRREQVERSLQLGERRPESRRLRAFRAAVIASGVLAAMGGAFISIGFVHSFNQNMTAGRGFIALAVVIVGKWRPGAALAAALLFGFTQALAQRLPVFSESSATLLQALPYVVTLIAVAGLVGRSVPPAADGVPYSKE